MLRDKRVAGRDSTLWRKEDEPTVGGQRERAVVRAGNAGVDLNIDA
jgi:hypothetical protein